LIPVRDTAQGATFSVKVHPRAKRNAIAGEIGESLKVALTAPPVEGKANDACIAFLAEFFGVSRSAVMILAGESNRQKVVRVAGISAEQIRRTLEKA
jgi:uncharacterized protein (TIGR00251 family)